MNLIVMMSISGLNGDISFIERFYPDLCFCLCLFPGHLYLLVDWSI